MEAQPRQIQNYLTAEGTSPFEEWLDSLQDRNAKTRIKARLKRLNLGNFGDSKSVGSGVYELKIDYGPGYRIYYGLLEQLLCFCCVVETRTHKSRTSVGQRSTGQTMKNVKMPTSRSYNDYLIANQRHET